VLPDKIVELSLIEQFFLGRVERFAGPPLGRFKLRQDLGIAKLV